MRALGELLPDTLLLDGGMGTALLARGLCVQDEPADAWNLHHPRHVLEVHREFLAAGAGASETCLDPALPTGSFVDAATPPADTGWWYLVTAANACLADGAPWGFDSLGLPRAPAICP